MAQTLSPMTPRHVLPAASPAIKTLVRLFGNRLEQTSDFRRRAIPDRLAPTEAERAALAARVAVIDGWLAPARDKAIHRIVGTVRGLMASSAAGDPAEVLRGYAMVLRGYPEAVIDDVCTRFLDGRLGNRVYAPTPAEIAHECLLAVADALSERGRIGLILDAEVYRTPSPDEQAEIQAEFRRFVAEATAAATAKAKPGPVEPTGTDALAKARAEAALTVMEAAAEAETPVERESAQEDAA